MVTLENLRVELGSKLILNGVSFTIGDREKVGLVGINGVGKSTLLKVIARKNIVYNGNLIFSKSAQSIGYVPQTSVEFELSSEQKVLDFLRSGRPLDGIEREIEIISERLSKGCKKETQKELLRDLAEKQLQFECWGGYRAEAELFQIIEGMNLGDINLNTLMSKVSGGQKSRIIFARTLYSTPDILLLDEPTNHLDPKSREWTIGFLRKYSKAILVVSHEGEFLDAFVTKIVRIDEETRRSEVFPGNYRKYGVLLKQRERSAQRSSIKKQKEIDRLKQFIDSMNGVSGKRKRQAQSREKALERLLDKPSGERRELKRLKTICFGGLEKGDYLPIQIQELCFSYPGCGKIIENLSLSLISDEKLAIVGKNGAGKTTILKLMAGKLKPVSGSIILGSKTKVGYYTQEQEDFNPHNNLLEELSGISCLPSKQLRGLLGRYLFVGDKVFQRINTLSSGEKSRLSLLKLTLYGANLLLLDEPTNHLDDVTREIVVESLNSYNGSIVVVSHDPILLERLGVEKMLILPQGKIQIYNAQKLIDYGGF